MDQVRSTAQNQVDYERPHILTSHPRRIKHVKLVKRTKHLKLGAVLTAELFTTDFVEQEVLVVELSVETGRSVLAEVLNACSHVPSQSVRFLRSRGATDMG